ncbi:MAG: hypothetical protein LBD17_01385 [Endomicrobium sp.]|jgi:hypothetical protein|nr:hypothetical protein [Endomicrobium sp.]
MLKIIYKANFIVLLFCGLFSLSYCGISNNNFNGAMDSILYKNQNENFSFIKLSDNKVKLKYGDIEKEFNWITTTPRQIAPKVKIVSDNDGNKTAIIILNVASGTGIDIDELHVVKLRNASIDDHKFGAEEIKELISKTLKWKTYIGHEGKPFMCIYVPYRYVEGDIDVYKEKPGYCKSFDISQQIKELNLSDKDISNIQLTYGDIVKFHVNNFGDIKVEVEFGITSSSNTVLIYTDIKLFAYISMKKNNFRLYNLVSFEDKEAFESCSNKFVGTYWDHSAFDNIYDFYEDGGASLYSRESGMGLDAHYWWNSSEGLVIKDSAGEAIHYSYAFKYNGEILILDEGHYTSSMRKSEKQKHYLYRMFLGEE